MVIFSRLATTIGYIFALQLGAAAVFVPLHTEVRKVFPLMVLHWHLNAAAAPEILRFIWQPRVSFG
jgi:hypothetical protein